VLDSRGGGIRDLRVERHSYRVILLAAPGTFEPAPTLERPPAGERIEKLCDSFTEIGPQWTQARSPKLLKDGEKDPGLDPWCMSHSGRLRLYGGKGGAMQVRRPFEEDNCAVQVQVRGWGTSLDARSGPALYWDPEHWVQLAADFPQAAQHEIRFSVRTQGTSKLESAGKPVPLGVVNWARIELRPDRIEFLASTDGRAWHSLGHVTREGIKKPPAWLILGQGRGGTQPFLLNDGQCATRQGAWAVMQYYDDLIVTRLPQE